MESITIKVDDNLAKEIDKAMKPLYSTKTEFIREALREKIQEIKKERSLQLLRENFGKGKHLHTTDEELEKIREEVAKKYMDGLD